MTAGMDRAQFLKTAAALGAGSLFAPAGFAAAAGAPRRRLAQRGICYDTGTNYFPGYRSRGQLGDAAMRREIRVIAERLHCNSISVFGTELERLAAAAAAATARDLHVWLQPRLIDRPQEEILDLLARTAREAARLRERDGKVSLNVGCEFTLFTPGIVPGATWEERIAHLSGGAADFAAIMERLNAFLARAAAIARSHFGGKITYAAASFEDVDWRPFDMVGLDYYSYHRERSAHIRELRRFRRFKKPIVICEFGACAFKGSPQMEGGGWQIVDYSKPVPEIRGGRVRSERVQADHIVSMLDLFEAERIHSASVYTFIEADLPRSRNPRFDLDMASFGIVAVVGDGWKPKRAFHALAERYG